MTGRGCFAALAMAVGGASAAGGGEVFTPQEVVTWEQRTFTGPVEYRATEIDGREAVHATCDGNGATALYLAKEIDLTRTPILEWSWRIERTFGDIDETSKAGDDYPARLYAVYDGGWRRWRTEAVNYVWASALPEGSTWPNAYTSRARMVALRSGTDRTGEWVTERRNLVDDFRELHGTERRLIHGIAIMTDCDDTGQPMEGWYGEIRLLPETGP